MIKGIFASLRDSFSAAMSDAKTIAENSGKELGNAYADYLDNINGQEKPRPIKMLLEQIKTVMAQRFDNTPSP